MKVEVRQKLQYEQQRIRERKEGKNGERGKLRRRKAREEKVNTKNKVGKRRI